MGKYESNAIALRLALTYSDRMIEAYDVLVALLESELASSVDRRIDNRRVIENVAHVLNKLENDCSHLSAPWEDNMILSDGCVLNCPLFLLFTFNFSK